MGKVIDMTGQRFGKLTVISQAETKNNRAMWLCQCDCGNEKIVAGKHLRNGMVKSCGCYIREYLKECKTKHSKCNSKLYYVYNGIKDRCYNSNKKGYKNYGGRGIVMCQEWLNDFMSFYNWAIENGYSEESKRGEYTIDRIDNNGNYEPSNCRWITIREQQKNKRNNRYITFNEETKTLTDWSLSLGFSVDTVRRRLKDGWSIERALTERLHKECISKFKKENISETTKF